MDKFRKLKKYTPYLLVTAAFIILTVLKSLGLISRSLQGMLVPICVYIVMAVSLNMTVGILGALSLGHAGFMSVGAFSGIVLSECLCQSGCPDWIRLILALIFGALFAGFVGFLIGFPVLRLRGDYLAIVTLAFGEIIKEIMTCLIIGCDENGLHIIFNVAGTKTVDDLGLTEAGQVIIKGAQGATGTHIIANFTMGFILIMIALAFILNLINSKSGRAIMALRDNEIAAESVGIDVTKYKMMAFVCSAAFAGAAGALYGLNYSNLIASKFDFNTSILVLVFVVLGGLGNMTGSIIAATILTILPEALREFSSYRMLIYAIVLIIVMIGSNNPKVKNLLAKILPKRRKSAAKGGEV